MEQILQKGFQLLRSSFLPAQSLAVVRKSISSSPKVFTTRDDAALEKNQPNRVINLVNDVIERKAEGRMFAVVQVCGKQFKVTNNDIIVVDGYWPPDIGDEIRLEKVLLAGASDFTLIGRPLLPLNQVFVKATVIEKNLTHTKITFTYMKRKQFKNTKLMKVPLTYLRINSISLQGKVNELGDVDGNEGRIF